MEKGTVREEIIGAVIWEKDAIHESKFHLIINGGSIENESRSFYGINRWDILVYLDGITNHRALYGQRCGKD